MGLRAALVLWACTSCGLVEGWFSSGRGGSLFSNRDSVLGSFDFGSSRLGRQSGLLDSSNYFGRDTNFFNNRNGYNGFNQQAAKQAGQKTAGGQRAQRGSGAQDDFFGDNARSLVDRAVQHGFHSGAQAGHAQKQAAQQGGFHNVAGKKRTFNRAKVLDDGVDFEFDKRFKKRTRERGGYEEETEESRKKSDKLLDKEKKHKLSQSDQAAAKAQSAAQKALKGSQFSETAAQKKANSAKYGQAEKSKSKAGERNEDQEVVYDRKDSRHKETDRGLERALKKANQQANKHGAYDKASAADAAAQKSLKDSKYAGVGKGGEGGAGGLKGGGGLFHSQSGENAKHLDAGKENAAKNAALNAAALNEYNREKDKVSYDEVKGLKSNVKDKLKEKKHEDSKEGYSSKQDAAAKAASGSDQKYAASAAQSKGHASKHNRNEDLLDREQTLKKQQEDVKKTRKFKKFFHDKDEGGDNYEKLKYKRKRVEKEYGDEVEKKISGGSNFAKAASKAKHNNFNTQLNDVAMKRVADQRGRQRGHKSRAGAAFQDGAKFSKAENYGAAGRSGHKAFKDRQQQKQEEKVGKKARDNSYAQAAQAQRAADANVQNRVAAQLGEPRPSLYSGSVLGAPRAGYFGTGVGNAGGYGTTGIVGGYGNPGYGHAGGVGGAPVGANRGRYVGSLPSRNYGGYGNRFTTPDAYADTGGYINKGGYSSVAYRPSKPQTFSNYQQSHGGLGSGFASRPSAYGSRYGLSSGFPSAYGQSSYGNSQYPAGTLGSGIFSRVKSRLGTGRRTW